MQLLSIKYKARLSHFLDIMQIESFASNEAECHKATQMRHHT